MRRIFAVCVCVLFACGARAADAAYDASGADNVRYVIRRVSDGVEIRVLGAGVDGPDQAVFAALKTKESTGAFFIPPEPGKTGSTVWLPFAADTLIAVGFHGGREAAFVRRWNETQWGAPEPAGGLVSVTAEPAQRILRISGELLGRAPKTFMAIYLKDLGADQGRGRFYGAEDKTSASGTGERVIRHYLVMESGKGGVTFRRAGRLEADAPKTRIYRTHEKFSGISDTALEELKAMGFTHLYLTAALREAADAGVPGEEFKALARRIHDKGMKVMVGFAHHSKESGEAARQYPHGGKPGAPLPDTWKTMDQALANWQELGVDGFWADRAHLAPPEFWRWAITRARARDPGACFVAAADGTDPAKVVSGDPGSREASGGDVRLELLDAGFDAISGDSVRGAVTAVDDSGSSANDIDGVLRRAFLQDNTLHYAENSAEVAPAALLLGLSRGPVMIGGEPADGVLFPDKPSREFYTRLLSVLDQPAFREGDFHPLNSDNRENPHYGRVDNGESGRWLYSYLRHDPATGQRMMVVVNLHPRETLRDVRIRFTRSAMQFLGWDDIAGSKSVPIVARDVLGGASADLAEIATTPAEMENPGFPLKELSPLSAAYYELAAPGRHP